MDVNDRIRRRLADIQLGIKRRFYANSVVRRALDATARRTSVVPISQVSEPIFIVGCGHSGTTLLCAILDSHPKLQAIVGENYAFWHWHNRDRIAQRFGRPFEELINSGKRPVEKTPRHVYVIQNIFDLFPRSRMIYLVRDPRAVAVSIRNRTGSLHAGIRRWIADNRAALVHLENSRLKLIRFEDLLETRRRTLSEICEFVQIEFHESLLNHHDQHRDWYRTTAKSYEHARRRHQQVNTRIEEAYKDAWKSQLSADDESVIVDKCRGLMTILGYNDQSV